MGRHLTGLNPEQERAVRTTRGPLLVLAGAGTGKTRVVTCRIAQILAGGSPPDAICAVTFTNKAAREMRERVASLVGRERAEGMVVSTFHSLGLRILRESGEAIGIPRRATVADSGDQLAILGDALREAGLPRTRLRPADARFRISLWKNGGLLPDAVLEEAQDELDAPLAVAWRRYEEELRRRDLLDFDDLVVRTLELLETSRDVLGTLQDRWRYVLVDEYQDTNGCQYRMVRLLAGAHRNLCVVGDDDQSIYGWRGAEADRILRFSRDWPGASVVTLERNYRSCAPILEAAGRLIANNLTRRKKILKPQRPGGRPVALFVADDEKGETDFVVSRIVQLRMQERLRYEDCAVLFRANSQCRPLESALRERQIPYRVVGTRSFFDRREVRDLLAFLRLAHDERDDQALLRIVSTPPRGIGRGSLDRMASVAAERRCGILEACRQEQEQLPHRARQGVTELLALLDGTRERAQSGDCGAALEHLVERSGYGHHLRQTVDEPLELNARLAAIEELTSVAREIGRRSGGGLQGLLDALALEAGEHERNSDDEQGFGVTLMTMHAAKGLEFPVVFIVGLEEGLLPHGNSIGDEEAADDTAAVEEERRLLYVGLTRARQTLFLTRAASRRRFGREHHPVASRFLDEIGLDELEVTRSGSEPPAASDSRKVWLEAIRERLARPAEAGE